MVDKNALSLANGNNLVLDLIFTTADSIVVSPNEIIELENKIVLAIAIRLKAEIFMVTKINNNAFWTGIGKDQTFHLIKRFKNNFPNEFASISILEQVNLMTPENIHLNSFMYEPILDMSNEHLKKLYKLVSDLK